MREIKFRAWVVNNSIKEMHYADEIQINSADAKAFQLRVGFEDASPEKNNIEQWQKDIVWMQYTGLLDKNGKEIYEGDICLYIGTNMSSMEIKFENGSFVGVGPFNTHPISVYLDAIDFESIEVIGNIYEDKHLLL